MEPNTVIFSLFFLIQLVLNVFFIYNLSLKTNQIQTIMATQEALQEQMNRLNAATSTIAQKLTDLQDKLANAGLPADVEDDVLAQLKAAADALEAMGNTNPPAEA